MPKIYNNYDMNLDNLSVPANFSTFSRNNSVSK